MSWRKEWSKIRSLFHRHNMADDLEEEIRSHLTMEEQENRGAGMSEREAHASAMRRFGNVTLARVKARETWRWRIVDTVLQDLRFGLRQQQRSPEFTSLAVTILAIGMGATTAVFSLMNGLLFKELPLPEPKQLVAVTHGTDGEHGPSMSYPLFTELRKGTESAVELFGTFASTAELTIGTAQRKVSIEFVSGNFYNALQVQPALGRLLEPENDRRSSVFSNAAVISHRLWRKTFHAEAGILGKKILLDGVPFVVIGILPKSFTGVTAGSNPDVTITTAGYVSLNPRQTLLACLHCSAIEVMGRLRPGASVRQAEARLRVAWKSALRDKVPDNLPNRYRQEYFADRLYLDPANNGLDSYLRNTFSKPLYLLLGMSTLILLAACANVANLLLARTQARQRELAIRYSTGASQGRITQQLLTECLMLSTMGLIASWPIYQVCVSGLVWFMQDSGQNIYLNTNLDVRMAAFAIAMLMVTVLLFGMAPALRASRSSLRTTLATNAANLTSRSRSSSGILALQVALSLMLLTSAILLARSLYELKTFDAGFRRDHLLIASPDLSKAIPNAKDQRQFEQRIMARIGELPGVRSASISALVPVTGRMWMADFTANGFVPKSNQDTNCYVNFVSTRFFETLGTPIVLGRDFTAHDAESGAPPTAIVSESLARHFWGKQNPIGKQIHAVDKAEPVTVVGVAHDAKYRSLRDSGARTVYLRFPSPALETAWNFQVEVWTSPKPEAMMAAVRNAFQRENAQVPVELHTFDQLLGKRLLYERLLVVIAISFGTLALLMSAIGVYGVAAYAVSRRTLEVGIRLALGATKPQIVRLFIREHLTLSLAGLIGGVIGALGLGQFLRAWLFGVSSNDLPSFVVSVAVLVMVSILATLLPVLRMMQTEASSWLRSE